MLCYLTVTCPLDIFLFCIGSLYQQFLDGLLTELPSYRCKFIFANRVLERGLTNNERKISPPLSLISFPFSGEQTQLPPPPPHTHTHTLSFTPLPPFPPSLLFLTSKFISCNTNQLKWTDPVWFIHVLGFLVCFWYLTAWPPTTSFIYLSFSTLLFSYLWKTDTVILVNLNKLPSQKSLPQ